MRSLRHILVAQPYGIGDALFMTPLLRALRTLPTVESVDLLLGSRTESVFRNNPHVDQIFSIDKGRWQASKAQMAKDARSLWKNLRGRYDLLIDFSLQREYGFYGGLFLGIPRRIGFNFKHRGIFLTQSISLQDGYEGAPAVDFYCEVGRLIGLEIEDRFLEFYVTDEDRKEAEEILCRGGLHARPSDSDITGGHKGRPYIAIAPGGGESWGKDAHFKRWPTANFIEAISLIKERIDFENVLILGSEGEKGLGEEICRGGFYARPSDSDMSGGHPGRPYNIVNLCGELSLGATAALLEKAVLFLANDGGLVHLAHALRVPLISLFGPVDPRVYGPYPAAPEAVAIVRENLPCRPCYFRFRYNSACLDRECLTSLSPREVMEDLDRSDFWKGLCVKV